MPVSGSYPMRSSLPNHAAVLLRASPSAQPLLGLTSLLPRRPRQRGSRPSPLSRRTWRLPTTACEHRPTARACHERRSNRPNGNRTTTPPRTSSGRREGTSAHSLKHPSPWSRHRPHRRPPHAGYRSPQHSVPRVHRVGPVVFPLPSLQGKVLLTLQRYALADHVIDNIVAPLSWPGP